MSDRYSPAPWQRRAVRVLAIVFLALGVHRTATMVLPLAAPSFMVMEFAFGEDGIRIGAAPLELLPDDQRAAVQADPAAQARYAARLSDMAVRLRLWAIELIGRLPELALMYCMGIALWRSARPQPGAALSGIPWLLRASLAGVALALVTPIAEAFRTGLLLHGVIPAPAFYLDLDLDKLEAQLLFAAGAWAATWTIASGLRARAELETIV
jgi:hypothetical protein